MNKLSDEELIEELQQRFSQNKKSLNELSRLMRQLQKVNKQLKEAENLKSQFLSNIRNEMNNPLASIIGLSKNIQAASHIHPEKISSMAALIHAEAFDLDFQLKNIFAAAELESGEWPLEVVQVDIISLMNAVLEMHQHQIQARNIQLQIVHNISSGLVHFQTDSIKLQLILSNLFANAIAYSHIDGHLKVNLHKQEKDLAISIQDFGIGISPEDHEIIFNRFTQLNTGVTRTHRGHGLGLSVTKALLEILNGQITLVSNINQGSTFTIKIEEFKAAQDNVCAYGNDFFFSEEERF